MLRAYKYRIYPTAEQKVLIEKHFGCCRLVFNLALEIKQYAYKTQQKYLSAIDLCYQIPALKNEFTFLKEIDSQALQASVKKLDIAFKNFFKHGAGFPKFKSKYDKQSYQCPNNTRRINWNENTLDLPKIKGIPIVLSRTFKGEIKTITISRTPTYKYFVSVLVNTNVAIPEKQKITEEKTIGIDLGIKDFLITSDGQKVSNPKFLRNGIERLKVLQRRASKKQKGGKNRKKTNFKVAIQHEKIKNKRDDFLHKLSSRLIRDNQADTFVFENLSSRNMMANHCLAQAISDVSWAKFVEMMKYKADWYGKNIIQIGRFEPSSKTCSNCGFVNNNLTLADRDWQCVICGEIHDRDINAAKNIKFMGLRKSGVRIPEEPVESFQLWRTMKQENGFSINQ